jgi:hypothetical protein
MASFAGSAPRTNYTPDEARAALSLPAVAPKIIPPLVTNDAFGGLHFEFGHKITTEIGTVNIADQAAAPTKPADKAVSFSTYGVVIPISIGRRRIGGNIVESSTIQTVMLGTYDYFVEYQIPITTTDAIQGGIAPDSTVSANDTLQLEQTRTTHTVRVYQNNDNTSPNWVDVEVIDGIQFKNPDGLVRDFTLNNP